MRIRMARADDAARVCQIVADAPYLPRIGREPSTTRSP